MEFLSFPDDIKDDKISSKNACNKCFFGLFQVYVQKGADYVGSVHVEDEYDTDHEVTETWL